MRGVFITATGTGVGKTVVAAGLLRQFVRNGIAAAPMKPIQTGAVPGMIAETGSDGELRSPDLEFCLAAAQITPKADEMPLMCPYLYEPACSPHLAGRMSGRMPSIKKIEEAALVLAQRYEVLIVEGAGGPMAPLNEDQLMLDLIKTLGMPAIVVAGIGLGTINHTLLTVHALRRQEVEVLGIIFNHYAGSEPDPDPDIDRIVREDNPKIIEKFSGLPTLGTLPYMAGIGADSSTLPVWEQFSKHVRDLTPMFRQADTPKSQ